MRERLSFPNKARRLFLSSLMLAATACGAGGGGEVAPDATVTVLNNGQIVTAKCRPDIPGKWRCPYSDRNVLITQSPNKDTTIEVFGKNGLEQESIVPSSNKAQSRRFNIMGTNCRIDVYITPVTVDGPYETCGFPLNVTPVPSP